MLYKHDQRTSHINLASQSGLATFWPVCKLVQWYIVCHRTLISYISMNITGPACDAVCAPAAKLAGVWNIPMISYGCVSTVLSDKTKRPTFARTVAPSKKSAGLVSEIMTYFQWQRIMIVTGDGGWHKTATAIKVSNNQRGLFIWVPIEFSWLNTRLIVHYGVPGI